MTDITFEWDWTLGSLCFSKEKNAFIGENWGWTDTAFSLDPHIITFMGFLSPLLHFLSPPPATVLHSLPDSGSVS